MQDTRYQICPHIKNVSNINFHIKISKLIKIDAKTSQQLRVEVLVYQRVPEEGQCGTGRRETRFTPLSPLLFCLLPSPFSSGPTSIPNPPGATHVLDMSLNIVSM